jgi:hypothetical protein
VRKLDALWLTTGLEKRLEVTVELISVTVSAGGDATFDENAARRRESRPAGGRERGAGVVDACGCVTSGLAVTLRSQWGTTQNAITAYWTAAATMTRAWKTSWYPNTAGTGSGRLTA